MSENGKGTSPNRKRNAPRTQTTESVAIAQRGVRSSEDFRHLMCAMMADVVRGDITPEVVNAACNAGRGLLKMVELEYRASTPQAGAKPSLPLSRRIAAEASA